jgi:Glycosyl hydrolase family 26
MSSPGFRSLALFVALLIAATVAACGGEEQANPAPAATTGSVDAPPAGCDSTLNSVAPPEGVYFGVNLDWENDSPVAYAERLGRKPAIYVLFAAFPLTQDAMGYVSHIADLVRAQDGMLMLTLEPNDGLETVTPATAQTLGQQLATLNARGVPVLLRFAHEMNGGWYPWSQDPAAYVAAFRQVADAVHAQASETAMVWAPNYGGGYPFSGGKYSARKGSDAFSLLDTDEDGVISMHDDPYAPYYPGDDAVDWVGMSLYHWGSAYPWGENELPEPGKFAAQLTGTYNGLGGDDSALPDFYQDYAVEHGKPLSITETAAFYAVDVQGDAEDEIKRLWWQEVLPEDLTSRFPNLKMINWFEWRKFETEVDGLVDWTVTRKAETRDQFQAALQPYLRFAAAEC